MSQVLNADLWHHIVYYLSTQDIVSLQSSNHDLRHVLSLRSKPLGDTYELLHSLDFPRHIYPLQLRNWRITDWRVNSPLWSWLMYQTFYTYTRCLRLVHMSRWPRDVSWPKHLQRLILSVEINVSLDHLPSQLTYLALGCNTHQSLDHLPDSLLYLKVYGKFNQPLDHLPAQLKQLHIKSSVFNRPLDYLPAHLEILVISCDKFDQPLDHLPFQLKKLRIRGAFEQSTEHLPSSLEWLEIENPDCHVGSLDHLPQNLKYLYHTGRLIKNLEYLPPNLCTLFIFGRIMEGSLDHLPTQLKRLTLGCSVQSSVDHLPSSLRILRILSTNFWHYVDHLPCRLTQLHLDVRYVPPLDHLPTTLTHLTLHGKYLHQMDHLPNGLRALYLAGICDIQLDHLPLTIEHMITEHLQNPMNYWPAQLSHLLLRYRGFDSLRTLPSTLTFIRLHCDRNSVDCVNSYEVWSWLQRLDRFPLLERVELINLDPQIGWLWPLHWKYLLLKNTTFTLQVNVQMN